MAKIWLCRNDVGFGNFYKIYIGRKPKKPEKNRDEEIYWPENVDHVFCSEMFEDYMGRSLRLKPGEGPVEIEIFPKKRGRYLVAMLDKEFVELFNSDGFTIWDFDLKDWKRMAPRGLVPKKGKHVQFWVRKVRKGK